LKKKINKKRKRANSFQWRSNGDVHNSTGGLPNIPLHLVSFKYILKYVHKLIVIKKDERLVSV